MLDPHQRRGLGSGDPRQGRQHVAVQHLLAAALLGAELGQRGDVLARVEGRGDPVALGLVASLSRPGGNLTGVSSLSVEVSLKRLEFMSELFPAARTFAVAVNPASPTSASQSTANIGTPT